MAIGAVSALKNGYFPTVCGFDGITLLGYIDYDILTVRQNFYAVSQSAIEEVDRLLQGEKPREIIKDYEITTIHYEDVIM